MSGDLTCSTCGCPLTLEAATVRYVEVAVRPVARQIADGERAPTRYYCSTRCDLLHAVTMLEAEEALTDA